MYLPHKSDTHAHTHGGDTYHKASTYWHMITDLDWVSPTGPTLGWQLAFFFPFLTEKERHYMTVEVGPRCRQAVTDYALSHNHPLCLCPLVRLPWVPWFSVSSGRWHHSQRSALWVRPFLPVLFQEPPASCSSFLLTSCQWPPGRLCRRWLTPSSPLSPTQPPPPPTSAFLEPGLPSQLPRPACELESWDRRSGLCCAPSLSFLCRVVLCHVSPGRRVTFCLTIRSFCPVLSETWLRTFSQAQFFPAGLEQCAHSLSLAHWKGSLTGTHLEFLGSFKRVNILGKCEQWDIINWNFWFPFN